MKPIPQAAVSCCVRTCWLVLALGCGGPTRAAPPPANASSPARDVKAAPASEITADAFCTRFVAIVSSCGWAGKFDADPASCRQELGTGDPNAQLFLHRFAPCLAHAPDCDAVAGCMSDAAVDKGDLRACADHDPSRTVGEPRATWEQRKGAHVTRFGDAHATRDEPIEVCGIPAENDWLVQTACADGSHPFADRGQAEGARVGNIGPAGRCGSIVDHYRVKCPEAEYDLFLDGYVCPLP
jgi:hypothetical protein